MDESYLPELPNELLVMVLASLDTISILYLSRTCKHLYVKIINDNALSPLYNYLSREIFFYYLSKHIHGNANDLYELFPKIMKKYCDVKYNNRLDKNVSANIFYKLSWTTHMIKRSYETRIFDTVMVFGDFFNQKLQVDSIPNHIKHIIFGNRFNQPIEPGIIPSSITTIEFGCDFCQEKIHPNALPNISIIHYRNFLVFDIMSSFLDFRDYERSTAGYSLSLYCNNNDINYKSWCNRLRKIYKIY